MPHGLIFFNDIYAFLKPSKHILGPLYLQFTFHRILEDLAGNLGQTCTEKAWNEESAHRHTPTPRFCRLRSMNERNLAREKQKLIWRSKTGSDKEE